MATGGLQSPSLAGLPSPWGPRPPVVTPTVSILIGPKGERFYKIPKGETVGKSCPLTTIQNVRMLEKRGKTGKVSAKEQGTPKGVRVIVTSYFSAPRCWEPPRLVSKAVTPHG